jgi:hypothetical protein
MLLTTGSGMGSSRPPQVLLKEVLEYIARHGKFVPHYSCKRVTAA